MKSKSMVKPQDGLGVRLPLTVEEKQEYKRYIRSRHLVAGQWIADMVLKAIRDPHPEQDEGHAATRYQEGKV